ncbi:MAG: DUF309 domain-containing protein [Thermoanaerobaculia bacterium]
MNRSGIRDDPDFLLGIELFNSGRYWHAHEAWERLWLVAEGPRREFLQGLIQLAAACHHVLRGNLRGAQRLLDASLARLDLFPSLEEGIDLQALRESAAALRDRFDPDPAAVSPDRPAPLPRIDRR